jgi:hypothetical protein
VSQLVSTPSAVPERNVTDLAVTVVGLVVTGLLALVASVLGLMLVMASDSCGASSDCNTDLIGVGVLLAVVAPWLCWIPALVLTIVRQVRRRTTWWVPIAAALAYLPLVVVAFVVINAGIEPTG